MKINKLLIYRLEIGLKVLLGLISIRLHISFEKIS